MAFQILRCENVSAGVLTAETTKIRLRQYNQVDNDPRRQCEIIYICNSHIISNQYNILHTNKNSNLSQNNIMTLVLSIDIV